MQFYIIVKGEKIPVSKEIYKARQKFNDKIRYDEHKKKSEKITVDESGKITIELSAEDSIERLSEINRQFPDPRRSVEDIIIEKLTLKDALEHLTKTERKFIDLRFYKERKMPEIAKNLKIPLRTLYRMEKTILHKLHEILTK